MKLKFMLLTVFSTVYFSVRGQSQITTTGNNLIDLSNPFAADITIGSSAYGGIRHNSSIMFWSDNSASRIYGADDRFYFSVWNSSEANIGLAAGYGVSSYIKGNLGVGTANPLDQLDVKNIFRISGFNRNWRIMSHVADGNLYFRDETATNMVMTLATSGNVGIGTTDPVAKLTLNMSTQDSNGGIKLFGYTYPTDMSYWGETQLAMQYNGVFRNVITSNGSSYFNGGNVGIGTITPQEKLSVNGNIRAKEIKVETANWPDFVFEENYKITSLSDLEKYIKLNKHLPDMPSAKEVENEGLTVGDLLKKQQKMIEELTLHMIELKKDNELLKEEMHQKPSKQRK